MKQNGCSIVIVRCRFVLGLMLLICCGAKAFALAKVKTDKSDDIVIADFESDTYGDWKLDGSAFGSCPVRASVNPPSNRVVGHLGNGLVNTYLNGDRTTGKLTSPEFIIEREYINFLIGAGGHAGETCIDLVIDGKVVRTSVGPERKDSRGREILDWKSWDIAEFRGKKAILQIIDTYTGRWGHINIDHIVQSDKPRKPTFKDIGNKSLVPQYPFANTLAEQEKQLKTNPFLERFRVSREKMKNDPHLPLYHFTSPENRLNDPDGLCFWQGRWHMFYQGYPPEDPRQHWGHAVSDDLIHWRDLPYAIYPNPERACYSGSTLVEDNRVIAMYHGTQVGSMVAVSDDPLLLNWKKVTGKSVIPFAKPGEKPLPYSIFDPCIWKKGNYYYALTAGWRPDGPGGKRLRKEWLHRSKDLANWEYLHPFLEDDGYGLVGDDGACPYFWPIGTKYILLHFSHMTGGKYILGDYDTKRDKFAVTDGGDFNFGPYGPAGLHAPSAAPDGNGGVVVIFNMNEGLRHKGWNGIMSLPRRLTLDESDEIEQLRIEPAGETESLRYGHQSVVGIKLPSNEEIVFEKIKGSSMELLMEIDCQSAPMLELNVLRSPNKQETTRIVFYPERGYKHREFTDKRSYIHDSVVSIDTSCSSILSDAKSRPPETAPVHLEKKETLKLHVFIDKSVVEVFVNGKQCVSVRVYPGRKDSLGVSLHAQGSAAKLISLDAWQMKGVFESALKTRF